MKSIWFSKQTVVNKLTKALNDNPDCTIDVILSNPDLVSSVRNEVPELITYLEKDNYKNLKELFDLALSDRANNETMDFRFNRNAANVLSFSARAIQKFIQGSPVFIESLTQFMNDANFCRNPIYAGHFQRIIHSYLFATSGNIINTIPNLSEFLLKNIDILSYKTLLAAFISDFSNFVTETSLISKIAEEAGVGKTSNLFAVTLMSDVLQSTTEHNLFYTNEIIGYLISKASQLTDPKGNLLYFEIFHLLDLILQKYDNYTSTNHNEELPTNGEPKQQLKERDPWFIDLNKQYITKFSFDLGEATERNYAAFPFFSDFLFSSYSENPNQAQFNKFLDKMVPTFFEENAPCNFRRSFISHIKLMPNPSLIMLIKSTNLLKLIINAGLKMPYENPDKYTLGHVFLLALEIFTKNLNMPNDPSFISVSSNEWNAFLVNEILPKNDLISDSKAQSSDNPEYEF